MFISVIVTTYNAPKALEVVLKALENQAFNLKNFEVIIADDGSGPVTKEAIEHFQKQSPLTIKHVWQKDEGFRAGQIRNKAVAKAAGEYLIFLDGDSIPLKYFLKSHQKLARFGFFVAGNRVLASEALTKQILNKEIEPYRWPLRRFFYAAFQKKINRFNSLLTLPLGVLRRVRKHRWKGVKTCNLGMWKKDFLSVNGFDENYIGWGYEDSDLVIRLLRTGIYCQSAKFAAPVMHLWHPLNDRSSESENFSRLQAVLNNSVTHVDRGVGQYFGERNFNSSTLLSQADSTHS
jgi:glycosyltransferase involved in cell wall biosynthesis